LTRRLYTNRTSTTLAAGISNTATSLSVTPGGGASFPNPGAGYEFTATLQSATTPSINEVVLVSVRSSDVFTIARGQEGTTALAWSAGDILALLPTAGDMAAFAQFDDLQAQGANYAIDTGAANAYVVGLTPAVTSHVVGMPIRWKATHANVAGASTFNDGAGAAALVLNSGTPPPAGAILPGALYTSVWNGTSFFLYGSVTVYGLSAQELAATGGTSPADYSYPPGHILRYGINTTPGTTDMTAAFNAACMYTTPYTLPGMLADINAPPGQYAINGTVYVRKGQRIRGSSAGTYIVCNNSGTGPTFQMGWGLIGGTPTPDSGGQPVSIESLFLLGGPATGTISLNSIAGAFVRDIFFSGPGVGISITAAGDINIQNVIFDQGQNGIVINNGSNIQASLMKFYLMHFDLTINSDTYDCQFSDCHSEYNQFTSVLFGDSQTHIRNIRFTNWMCVYNAQFGTYTGAIENRSVGTVAGFVGCSFNNMPGAAYQCSAGSGSDIEFANCTFDGNATRLLSPPYTQSTTAAAIATANESVRCVGCTIKNMPAGNPISMGGSSAASTLELENCKWFGNNASFSLVNISATVAGAFRASGCKGDATQQLVNVQLPIPVSIRNCEDWFGVISSTGSSHVVTVPYQRSNTYQITLRANMNFTGNSDYRKCIVTYAVKSNDFTGSTPTSYIDTAVAVQGAAHGNGAMTLVVEFGAVGGNTNIPLSNSGVLAISWPNTYSSESVEIHQLI
jgi:hypothetical protein